MKRIVWVSAAVLVIGSVCGCGDSGAGSNSTTSEKDSKPTVDPSGNPPAVLVAAANPQEAVTSFLNALRQGNDEEAAALLTTTAREETVRHEMVVQPPGAPNAQYTVGRVEYPEGKDVACVSCVWSEKYEDGEEDSYEVVWILRQETGGWRIAGMATQLSENGSPVMLNFEDLADMEQKIIQAEIRTQSPEIDDNTRQATQPTDPIRR